MKNTLENIKRTQVTGIIKIMKTKEFKYLKLKRPIDRGDVINFNTPLTKSLLKKLDFSDVGRCDFKHFENMNYWVKNGVCLFYNVPIQERCESDFYVGYCEMREGEYVAVAFRWIKTFKELSEIYEGITNKFIINPI